MKTANEIREAASAARNAAADGLEDGLLKEIARNGGDHNGEIRQCREADYKRLAWEAGCQVVYDHLIPEISHLRSCYERGQNPLPTYRKTVGGRWEFLRISENGSIPFPQISTPWGWVEPIPGMVVAFIP
jgi:hypothetical protein